jgi:hypothetical protein
MGLWLTEKINETIGLTLRIKSTSPLKPLLIIRLNTAIKSFSEAPSVRLILLKDGIDETPFYRNQLYLRERLF